MGFILRYRLYILLFCFEIGNLFFSFPSYLSCNKWQSSSTIESFLIYFPNVLKKTQKLYPLVLKIRSSFKNCEEFQEYLGGVYRVPTNQCIHLQYQKSRIYIITLYVGCVGERNRTIVLGIIKIFDLFLFLNPLYWHNV